VGPTGDTGSYEDNEEEEAKRKSEVEGKRIAAVEGEGKRIGAVERSKV